MSKIRVLLCMLLFIAISIISIYFVIKHRYERNYNQIYDVYFSGFGSTSLATYYDSYDRVPDSFSDAAYGGMDIYYFLYYWNKEVRDWLSREPEDYPSYSYYRVYERTTKEAVGFVILSTGIDGKKDVVLSEKDTLYTDDYLKKIGVEKLYNPRNYYENHGNTHPLESPMPKFNLRDYFFGKKDLLLEYSNLKRDKAYNDSALRAYDNGELYMYSDSIRQQKRLNK